MKTERSTCWLCGNEICWDSDYDPEDFGIDGKGIVVLLHCTGCGAEIQYTKIDDEDEEQTL